MMQGVLTETFVKGTTTWGGESWNNGQPSGHVDAILEASFDTSLSGSFTCNNLYINNGALKITANCFIKVLGTTVSQTDKTTFTVEDMGELILLNKDVDASTVKATFKRTIKGLQRLDYWVLSSPFSGIPLIRISPTTVTSRFYEYRVGLFYPVDPNTTNFQAGKGFQIRTPAQFPTTVSDWKITLDNLREGYLNSGVIISRAPEAQGYTIIGNPYPAKLSLRKFIDANPNIINSYINVWHKTNNPDTNSYVQINKVAATRDFWDVNLLPFQGFFIYKKEPGEANILFTPDMQVLQHDFTTPDRFYFNLVQKGINIPISSISYTVQQYPDDFYQLQSTAENFAFVIDDKYYYLRQSPDWSTDTEIPLLVKPRVAAEYSLSLSSFSGVFASSGMFLYDQELDVKHDLKAGPYTLLLEAKEYKGRFIIRFK